MSAVVSGKVVAYKILHVWLFAHCVLVMHEVRGSSPCGWLLYAYTTCVASRHAFAGLITPCVCQAMLAKSKGGLKQCMIKLRLHKCLL